MCGGDGTARERFSAVEGVRAWAHAATLLDGWLRRDDSPKIVPDRARSRTSWRGSRRAGCSRRPCWRGLGVRRKSARSWRARIGTGAGTGTVSRRGSRPPGASRGALGRHPIAGVPGRVSLVAPGHGARAVARHRPLGALLRHQRSGVEPRPATARTAVQRSPYQGQGAGPGWPVWRRERPSTARPSPESRPVTSPPRGCPRAGDLSRAGEVRVSR